MSDYHALKRANSDSNNDCEMTYHNGHGPNHVKGENQNQPDRLSPQKESVVETPSAMSQWAKVEKNPTIHGQMQTFYKEFFPMEVRYFLSRWIEEQPWNNIDHNDPKHIPYSQGLIQEMLELLRQKMAELSTGEYFLIRVRVEQAVQKVEAVAKTDPLELVKIIKQCLAKELTLIEEAEAAELQQPQTPQAGAGDDEHDTNEQIMTQIQILFQQTKLAENDSKAIQQHQECFILSFSESQRVSGEIHQLQQKPVSAEKVKNEAALKAKKEQIDQQSAQLGQALLQMRINLSRKYQETINALQELQKQILDTELIAWKRRQQLAGNGLVINASSLDTLQHWCDSLADLIWQNRTQIKNSTILQQQLPIKYPDGEEDILPKLNETITGLLSSLVTSTFIVEQQPPQVLKKDARFGAVVRLLVGGKLNVHMNPPHVIATIISENQATRLLRNDASAATETSGEILNNTRLMEYQSSNGELSIHFKNMQLKKIKRADKKGSEAVTEEKFCIFFRAEFGVGGDELLFRVWTISLPVVVTVHGNQECNATATVLWDNAFSEAGRVPFAVPDQVEWCRLADQLNMKFKSTTGKGLTEMNLSYIASKLFGSNDNADPANRMVSWAMFNKDTLRNKPFTFWEWFYAIQKLTKDHLRNPWMNEAIIGFISKDQARERLSSRPYGTFLLRFSDSELGGITIAWRGTPAETPTRETSEVWNLAPFTSKDFSIRGLADRIHDLPNLVYLYPEKLKDSVFSKDYTNSVEPVRNDGYVRPHLITTIPDQFNPTVDAMPLSPDASINESNPASVQMNLEELPMGSLKIDQDFADFAISMTDYINQQDFDELPVDQVMASHTY